LAKKRGRGTVVKFGNLERKKKTERRNILDLTKEKKELSDDLRETTEKREKFPSPSQERGGQ